MHNWRQWGMNMGHSDRYGDLALYRWYAVDSSSAQWHNSCMLFSLFCNSKFALSDAWISDTSDINLLGA